MRTDEERKEVEKLKWLNKRLSEAEDFCKPYFDRAKRHYQLYRFGSAVAASDWPYVNRVRTRDILAFVEDSTAIMVQTLFNTEPFFSVDPRRSTEFDARFGISGQRIAKQMERVLDQQVSDEKTEFFEEIVDFFKGGGIFGNAYCGVYPRFNEENSYVGPLIKAIDFWNVLPISGARRMSKAHGVFVREYMSRDEAERLAEKAGMPAGKVKRWLFGYQADQWHKDLLAELGIENYDLKADDIEVMHYFSGGHTIAMANRCGILRDSNEPIINQIQQPQVIKPFPYDQPIVQYKYMPVPLEFFAMGIPEVLEVLQEDKNLIRSARRDNIDLVINKVLLTKAGNDLNYDLMKYYPGAIWHEALGQVQEMVTQDVTQSAYMEESKVAADMENALSFFGYARGMTPAHEERPTTVARLQQASLNRLDLNVKLTEFTVLRNIATRILLLTRRFMPQREYEAIVGEPDAGFYRMSEDMIQRYFLAKPIGSSVTKVKEIRQQQIQVAMGVLEKLQPIAKSGPEPFIINTYQAARGALEACEIKNIDQILVKVPPQQVQQEQMMAMAQQLQTVKYGQDIETSGKIREIVAKGQMQMAIDAAKPQPQPRGNQ